MDFPLVTKTSGHKRLDSINAKQYSSEHLNSDKPDEFVKPKATLSKSKKNGGILAGVVAFCLAIGAFFKNLRKPSEAKVVKKLIKTLHPKDIDLAKAVYPVFIRNKENFKIKPEHYNSMTEEIEKKKEFMLSEGLELISSKAEKLKDYIVNPEHDLGSIIKSLTPKNKTIFASVAENLKDLKVEFADDISMYMQKIKPEKHDYIFKELLPLLKEHDNILQISNPENLAKVLNYINPETQKSIEKYAASAVSKKDALDSYKILTNVTKDNIDCLEPIIENMEKLELDEDGIVNTLKVLKNENAHSIEYISDVYKNVIEANLNPTDILKILKNQDQDEIFAAVMQNPKLYKITILEDLQYYLKHLDIQNLEFATKVAMPKLAPHIKTLNIKYAEQISDILSQATPEILNGYNIVAEYARINGPHCAYDVLLRSIDKDNIGNLPTALKNLKNSELWDNYMVDTGDFKNLLNK